MTLISNRVSYSSMLCDRPIKDSRDPNGGTFDDATAEWSANGYRLPTEGEWQFAASGRADTPYDYASGATSNYKSSSACKKVAWYEKNSNRHTHIVGRNKPNALGLYDMSGNVWEWCWDWYGDYPSNSRDDYRGSSAGSSRVERGGGWYDNSRLLQVGYRYNDGPYYECRVVFNELCKLLFLNHKILP